MGVGTRKPGGPLGLLAQAKGQQVGWGWKLYDVALSSTLLRLLSLMAASGGPSHPSTGLTLAHFGCYLHQEGGDFYCYCALLFKIILFLVFWTQSHYRPLASQKLLNPG